MENISLSTIIGWVILVAGWVLLGISYYIPALICFCVSLVIFGSKLFADTFLN